MYGNFRPPQGPSFLGPVCETLCTNNNFRGPPFFVTDWQEFLEGDPRLAGVPRRHAKLVPGSRLAGVSRRSSQIGKKTSSESQDWQKSTASTLYTLSWSLTPDRRSPDAPKMVRVTTVLPITEIPFLIFYQPHLPEYLKSIVAYKVAASTKRYQKASGCPA